MSGAGSARFLSRRDLFRLRRSILNAERAELTARRARLALRELLLELEYRYGLLGRNAHIDVHTGAIRHTTEEEDGHKPDAHPAETGPEGQGRIVLPVD